MISCSTNGHAVKEIHDPNLTAIACGVFLDIDVVQRPSSGWGYLYNIHVYLYPGGGGIPDFYLTYI